MEQVTKISIHSLKIHPRNTEFFDDIEGEMYEQFKQSIKEDGVLTPIIVAPDMTIISGHQRYLACKDLNIELIPAIIREELVDEDLKLRQLIASNFGRLSNNPSKFRKAVAMYVELNGNTHGGNRKSKDKDYTLKLTQDEIAKELGISTPALKNLLSLERNLIPELKQSLDNGLISKTSALAICSKLDQSEQEELLTELTKLIGDKASKNPNKNKISATNKEIENLTEEIKHLRECNKKLQEKSKQVQTVEIDNTDYSTIGRLKEEKRQLELRIYNLQDKIKGNKKEVSYIENPDTLKEIDSLKEKLKEQDNLINEKNSIEKELNDKKILLSKLVGENKNLDLISSVSENRQKIMNFLKDMAQYDYLSETFNEIPNASRQEWVRSIYGIFKWARNILDVVKHDDSFGVDQSQIIDVDYKIN